METASSSETSPTVCRLTRHHTPEDSHIHSTPSNTLLSITLFALPLTYQGQEKKRSGCGGGRNRFPARDNRITLDTPPPLASHLLLLLWVKSLQLLRCTCTGYGNTSWSIGINSHIYRRHRTTLKRHLTYITKNLSIGLHTLWLQWNYALETRLLTPERTDNLLPQPRKPQAQCTQVLFSPKQNCNFVFHVR